MTKYSTITVEPAASTRITLFTPPPSMMDAPFCAVKVLFQPPDNVRPLVIVTTLPPLPVYVPLATWIISPTPALEMAPSIVRHGDPAAEQELELFPVVDTYQVAPTKVIASLVSC